MIIAPLASPAVAGTAPVDSTPGGQTGDLFAGLMDCLGLGVGLGHGAPDGLDTKVGEVPRHLVPTELPNLHGDAAVPVAEGDADAASLPSTTDLQAQLLQVELLQGQMLHAESSQPNGDAATTAAPVALQSPQAMASEPGVGVRDLEAAAVADRSTDATTVELTAPKANEPVAGGTTDTTGGHQSTAQPTQPGQGTQGAQAAHRVESTRGEAPRVESPRVDATAGAGPTAPTSAAPATAARNETTAAGVTGQVFGEVGRLVSRGDGTRRLTIKLYPEALGEVRVVLTVRQGEVHVRMAGGDVAQHALLQGAPDLHRLLDQAGATTTHVVVGDHDATTGGQQHGQPTGFGESQEGTADTRRNAQDHRTAGTRDGSTSARDGSDGGTPTRASTDPGTRALTGVDVTM